MAGCARPTCGEPGAVALGYDPVGRVAWFGDIDDDGPIDAITLCATHAARVTLPDGWTARDDRTDEPSLWLPASQPQPTAPRPTMSTRVRRTITGEDLVVDELPLWGDEKSDPTVHLADALYHLETSEKAGTEEDGDHGPDAADGGPVSPLMARAFRAAGLD